MADAARTQMKAALKEDIKLLLEELWDAEEEEALYKIFTRESKKGMQKVLRYSKEDLQVLSYREDDGTVFHFKKHEVGDVRMLVHYQQYLIVNGLFPEDIDDVRFNSVTSKD